MSHDDCTSAGTTVDSSVLAGTRLDNIWTPSSLFYTMVQPKRIPSLNVNEIRFPDLECCFTILQMPHVRE
jgi:hypothetical protein